MLWSMPLPVCSRHPLVDAGAIDQDLILAGGCRHGSCDRSPRAHAFEVLFGLHAGEIGGWVIAIRNIRQEQQVAPRRVAR